MLVGIEYYRTTSSVSYSHISKVAFVMFLPGEAGEVPRRGGGVMGRTDLVAHDPSGTDYRATSPR